MLRIDAIDPGDYRTTRMAPVREINQTELKHSGGRWTLSPVS
jgi:hypothetical protein